MLYNRRHEINERFVMPKRKAQLNEEKEKFGERMARFRQEAGFSQRDLAAELGISQRMVAYYEKESEHPPTHLMPLIAKTLGVTADQLLGLETTKETGKKDTRLWRRFNQVEKLPPAKRKQIMQILDAFLGTEKAKKAA